MTSGSEKRVLDDFLRWASHARPDSATFPYGQVSWWVARYLEREGQA